MVSGNYFRPVHFWKKIRRCLLFFGTDCEYFLLASKLNWDAADLSVNFTKWLYVFYFTLKYKQLLSFDTR